MKTILTADAVVTCNDHFDVLQPGSVVLDEDGRIVAVQGAVEAPDEGHSREIRIGGILMPGLVNTHCHSPMMLLRGAGEDLPLSAWLRTVLWPREALLTAEDVYWGMALAATELLRFGVTTTCEMYVFPESVATAAQEAGLRCVITPSLIDVPEREERGFWRSQLDRNEEFLAQHPAGQGLVEAGLSAHSPLTLPLAGLEAVAALATRHGTLLHTHVAESQDEVTRFHGEHGRSMPLVLEDIGFLSAPRVLTAHGVWLSDDDLDCYARNDVAIAHCPQSNSKLGSGIAPVRKMLDRGLRVGIATDGPASNNDLDLWEEMRLTPLLQRAKTLDASVLTARESLTLATRGGAEALHRTDIGVLETGRWGDIIHLRTDGTAFTPMTSDADLLSHLLWSASSRHVANVWIAGKRVVSESVCTTIDDTVAKAEVQRRAERLAALA